MENKLDKYFKGKLHSREFDFKDSYWAAAEKLLEEQERRRRRGLLFWWFGGVAGLALLVAAIWFLGKNDSELAGQSNEVAVKERSAPIPTNGQAVEESKLNLENIKNDSEIVEENIPPVNKEIDENIKVEKMAKSQSGKAFSKKSAPISGGILQNINAEKKGDNNPFINQNIAGHIAPNTFIETENQNNLPTNTSPSADEATPDKRPVEDLAFLDLRQVLVYGDFTRPLKPGEAAAEFDKQSPFLIGITAAQLFQPNAKSGEKAILGYQAGLLLQYRLKGPWHLGTGLLYKYRTGTFDASKSAIGRNYRFGLETDTFVLRPSSLHYISIPLQLLWQKNRHILESGLVLDYLLGVRGEKGQYQRLVEPFVHRAFVAEEKGWLVEKGYKKFTTAAQLGYRYRVNKQLSFGISANYTFGGILEKQYEQPVAGQFLLKEADNFYLDLRAVYFIK